VNHRTDRAYLRDVQYRTDANLAARQSIYQYQQPHIDLVAEILDLAAAKTGDIAADVGCGNGRYLAGLAARRAGSRGLLAVEMTPGMLATARAASGAAPVSADAAMLPLRDGSVDVTLAMHMLYHVPDPVRAVSEFRRVTRPGGRVIVGLNGDDHMRELREIVSTAEVPAGRTQLDERLTLDRGEDLLSRVFSSVTRHDFAGTIVLTDPEPLVAYVRSMSVTGTERLVAAVTKAFRAPLRITTHSGCLVCTD
jgi:SAM-dependent methyltransferase